MAKYELVLLLDVAMKEDDRTSLLADLEKLWSDYIQDKDDIGMMQLQYDVHRKAGNNRAYFVSYYLDIPTDSVDDVKKALLYNKSIMRYMLFHMTNTQKFFHFNALQDELEKITSNWEEKRFGQRMTFFANDQYDQYLQWKSIPILRKYVTRFGNIKPRKYTANSVSKQKKLRKAILRARELGLVDYIRK